MKFWMFVQIVRHYSTDFENILRCKNGNMKNSKCEVTEKTNKMRQLDVYYQYFLNKFRVSLCQSSGEKDMFYCMLRKYW